MSKGYRKLPLMLNTAKLSITPTLTALRHLKAFYKSTSYPYRLYVDTYRFPYVWIFSQGEKLSIDVSFSRRSRFHIIITSRPAKLFFFHARIVSIINRHFLVTFRLFFSDINRPPYSLSTFINLRVDPNQSGHGLVTIRQLHSSPNHGLIRCW